METNKNSKDIISRYCRYLKLEKGCLASTLDTYMRDADKPLRYLAVEQVDILDVKLEDLEYFAAFISDLGTGLRSLARILSRVRQFYRFLVIGGYLEVDPAELSESPKQPDYLPEVLSTTEVDFLEQTVDLSKWEGHRNRAVTKVLFSCGLRVSELTNLELFDLHIEGQYIQVMGKSSKEHLVPVSPCALDGLDYWFTGHNVMKIKPGEEDYVFLDRCEQHLARIMTLIMIKRYAAEAGIKKTISPHVPRHSFVTSLLGGGTGLRVIQIMLGHESIGATEIYTHIDTSTLQQEILEHRPRNIQYNEHQ